MGSVTPYKTDAGKRYRVRYRRPGGAQTDKRGFKTKRDAEIFLASVEVNKASGTFLDPSRSRITIVELGPPWLAAKKASLKPSAYAPLEVSWRLRVQPRWGRVMITEITHSDVKAWVAELNQKYGASVVIRTYGVLASILDDAVHDRRIALNPARGGKMGLPKKIASRHIYLTHDQVERLALASGENATLVRTLAYTGMRWAEIVGLRVESLDFARGRIWVVQNAVEVGREVIEGTPKSHKIRNVPMPPFLRDELARKVAGLGGEDLVFPSRSGGFMRRVRTSAKSKSWFKTAAASIGVRKINIHDLRHTAASLSVQSGANVKAIQRMLGHASAAMTLDVYADLFDDDLDTVSMALDRSRSSQLGLR